MRQRRQTEKLLSVIAVLLLAVLVYMLWLNGARCVGEAHAEPPALELAAPPEQTAPKVEAAILWQTQGVPRHPVRRDAEWRAELAGYIAMESAKKHLPWSLTTAVIYRESSFRPSAKGDFDKDGNPQSIGLMQVGRGVQAKCRAAGLDLDDPHDQVRCGSWWLRTCWQTICNGNIRNGFAYYASGRVCRPDTKHLRSVVSDRFRLARQYERVASEVAP